MLKKSTLFNVLLSIIALGSVSFVGITASQPSYDPWADYNDDGIGEGTAEKVIEALNEHSGSEADLEKMLNIQGGKETAERIMSGVRQFRAAAWKVGLPKGQGTKEDIEAARMWNAIMLKEAIEGANKHPGTECVKEGM